MAAGVEPQSSCTLYAAAPASACSAQGRRAHRVALAHQQHVDRQVVQAAEHRGAGATAPGVTVVALRALGRAGAAAADRGDAAGQGLVRPGERREQVHVQVDRAGGEDLALAGDDVGAGADARGRGARRRRRRGCRPGRGRRCGRRVMPTSARTTPQWSSTMALVMTVSSAPSALVRGALAPSTRGSTSRRRRRPPRRRRSGRPRPRSTGRCRRGGPGRRPSARSSAAYAAAVELSHRGRPSSCRAGCPAPAAVPDGHQIDDRARGARLEPHATSPTGCPAGSRAPPRGRGRGRALASGRCRCAADLDRPVAGVDDHERQSLGGGAVGVELDACPGARRPDSSPAAAS